MTWFGSRRGAGGAATLMMVVAFLGIAGFIYWLNGAAEPAEVAVVEEDPVDDDGTMRVTFETFAADPGAHAGQRLRVTSVPITSAFGSNAFWTESGGQPFLVHIGVDTAVPASGTAEIVGQVVSMSDSVIAAWEEAGHVTSDGDKAAASFAETFFEAETADFTDMEGGA